MKGLKGMARRTTTAAETNEVVETMEVKETPVKAAPKKYEKDQLIKCISNTPGELGMVGKKTGILYRWANAGDETEVEYQDLLAAKIVHSRFIFDPLFVIQDDELVANWPDVQRVYDSMYSKNDLEEILQLTPSQMGKVVRELPEGAKNAIKVLAATNIQNGRLDSIRKIKILDEIFETHLIQELELFG